jgi:hypothetical protein
VDVEIGVGISHWELEVLLELSELLAVLSVLDNDFDGCSGDVLGRGGWVGCNDTRVGVAGGVFELREGMKKRLVGVVVMVLVVLSDRVRLVFLDKRRCSLGERGITTVEADKPSLEKRGVTS